MTSPFAARLAKTPEDLKAAQHLRYQVFVKELGSDGPMVDHARQLECDAFDPVYDHMLLYDTRGEAEQVIGAYRLLPGARRADIGQFYCEGEYDLTQVLNARRKTLELGRSCLAAPYRGGGAMMTLWQGLAQYILDHEVEVLVGVASFHGVDTHALSQPLAYLHHHHLAPADLRPRSKTFEPMDRVPKDQIDRRAAVAQIPALIKAYLRLGGCVGHGAFVDHEFNTTDVCLVLDIDKMPARQRANFIPSTQTSMAQA